MNVFQSVEYSDGLQKRQQRAFGGLNHTVGASENELHDMQNLSSKDFPVLAVRERRKIYRKLNKPNGIYSWDGLIYVDGTELYYRDMFICKVTDNRKTFCGMGNYVVILPDKLWLNTETEEHGPLGAKASFSGVIFGNGRLYDEDAAANMIEKPGADWGSYFKAGDAITITGCTIHTENNKTPIIREIDGDRLYFYENVFKLDGENGDVPYIESAELTFEREVPDMDFICENDNRLWGCRGNDIYASKLGDPFNWNVFDGLTTDSYAVTVGSAGKFTGCASYGSYAVFFKPDHIYKMYGNYPAAFQLMGSATLGLTTGSERSCAVAGETLFFNSRAGFTAYTGGIPSPVSAVFGNERMRNAAAGSDGLKYYVSAQGEDGRYRLYVFDTQNKCWHIEDDVEAIGFTWYDDCLYMLTADGTICIVGKTDRAPDGCRTEKRVKWFAEFADADNGSAGTKGVNKLRVRMELEHGSEAEVFVMFDSDGEWHRAGRINGERKQSYDLPIALRRCDHYRIKLTGSGGARLYCIEKQFYAGGDGRTI